MLAIQSGASDASLYSNLLLWMHQILTQTRIATPVDRDIQLLCSELIDEYKAISDSHSSANTSYGYLRSSCQRAGVSSSLLECNAS